MLINGSSKNTERGIMKILSCQMLNEQTLTNSFRLFLGRVALCASYQFNRETNSIVPMMNNNFISEAKHRCGNASIKRQHIKASACSIFLVPSPTHTMDIHKLPRSSFFDSAPSTWSDLKAFIRHARTTNRDLRKARPPRFVKLYIASLDHIIGDVNSAAEESSKAEFLKNTDVKLNIDC